MSRMSTASAATALSAAATMITQGRTVAMRASVQARPQRATASISRG